MRKPGVGGYRSRLERAVAAKMTEFGLEFQYEPTKVPYVELVKSGYCPHCAFNRVYQKRTYHPDFIVKDHEYVIEVKGKFMAPDRTKMLAIVATGIEVRMIFKCNNKLDKNKDKRYGDWCEKHGIKWATLKTLTPEFFA